MKSFLLDDRKILIPILLNAIVLFALGFHALPTSVARPLAMADSLFTLLFLAEMTFKLREWGFRGYIESHWNKLDFVLVMLSLPALGAFYFDAGDDAPAFFLLFRVCRVFKFFRFLRFIPGIDHMLAGVARAMRASVMLLLGFFIALFMVSLLSAKLFGAIDPAHFGDPLRAMYSTFKVFTVEGWYEIPDGVTDQLSGAAAFAARAYFIGLLLGAGVMGLSLVNSVFVDAMVADNNDDLEKKVDALREEIVGLRRDLMGKSASPPRPEPVAPGSEELSPPEPALETST